MNKFHFLIPMREAHRTLKQCLLSIMSQSYTRWRVTIVDDASSPESKNESKRIVRELQKLCSDEQVINLICRDSRSWETSNVLLALDECDDREIACRLDADDWLTENDALHAINAAYESTKCDVLWTMHRWGFTSMNISAPLPANADPYEHPWVSSHLKTWRASLSKRINVENYRNERGEFVKRAGDQAIFLPVLKIAANRVFLPIVTYHYNIEMTSQTFNSDDARFQRDEAEFIRRRGFIR